MWPVEQTLPKPALDQQTRIVTQIPIYIFSKDTRRALFKISLRKAELPHPISACVYRIEMRF